VTQSDHCGDRHAKENKDAQIKGRPVTFRASHRFGRKFRHQLEQHQSKQQNAASQITCQT